MVNTFDKAHTAGIARWMASCKKKSVVKASTAFTKAVVVGQPGIKGCAMVSFMEETNEPGRSGWLVSIFPDHHPKKVADGGVSLKGVESDVLFYWNDMLRRVEGVVQ